jgi:hypothetical protein
MLDEVDEDLQCTFQMMEEVRRGPITNRQWRVLTGNLVFIVRGGP